jgi:hypothetical protein
MRRDTEVVNSEAGPWIVVDTEAFRLVVLAGADGLNREDDNVDVEVHLASDGSCWAATVFTLKNLDTLMLRYEQSGECGGGLYLWADRMVVVRHLTLEALVQVVENLLRSGEFSGAFQRMDG